ncbi:MAG: TPM domain-containing protein [Bacteroidetes bacterium]|nr:TPM domain-containing protein [Bacteroidota bacterium]MBS1740330.1 TPM domain-containing protein [Bacteroidota bacterium]
MFRIFKPRTLLDHTDQESVVAAIRAAEAGTTGELRVYIESHCSYVDAMERAKEIFASLNMAKTERRNAILLYLALKDKQFAIFGDQEIYTQAGGAHFWEKAAHQLKQNLRKGHIAGGIVQCIQDLGDALATHFPYDSSVSRNELPDEIVFGK